ncbi:hypothetical protein K0M31_018544 [Melipona bicolor]|uniref:Uncharacterized protein n=1 Tax=Melipona bicolor TaxID=60889 RepID=A0AA40G3S3_9HYME|nr:hypothetical protein K0M31_018544 [Melipona bicolor]
MATLPRFLKEPRCAQNYVGLVFIFIREAQNIDLVRTNGEVGEVGEADETASSTSQEQAWRGISSESISPAVSPDLAQVNRGRDRVETEERTDVMRGSGTINFPRMGRPVNTREHPNMDFSGLTGSATIVLSANI